MGQSQAQPNQATVPGVRIDLTNLRTTTRFNDLNEELQKKIEEFDAGVLSLMSKGDQCTAILPAHGEQLELVPDNVDFLQRKVIGVQANLDGDVQAVSQTSKQVYVDGENSKLSFTVIDNLKLPQQFHTGIWNPSKPSPAASKPGEAAGDLVTFFSQTSDEMGQTISTYKDNIGEIELHLRGVERSLMQAGNNMGHNSQDGNEMEALVGVLRDFEMSILEVASKVGGAREGVQSLQLGHFIDPVSVNGNGKRRGVY
jgi:nucleoporin p58/p45